MNIVFLGDSVTQGCFEIEKNMAGEWELRIDPKCSYVALLEKRLTEIFSPKDIKVFNSGISGDSTKEALDRLERDVLEKRPDITVVCLALNNSGRKNIPEYVSQLSEIFDRIRSTGSSLVFLTPNMLNTYVAERTPDFLLKMAEDCADIQNNGEMDKLIDAGKETARNFGAEICDAYSEWKKLERYGVDTTALLCNHINHPKREMHSLFADMLSGILETEIRSILPQVSAAKQ